MSNLPRFNIGDLVRPVTSTRRRKPFVRLGVIVDVALHNERNYSYTVHWTASEVVSVGWADHTLEPL
jgi:hypothetical protein